MDESSENLTTGMMELDDPIDKIIKHGEEEQQIHTQKLESFAYRIDLAWWFFAGAGLIALLIAWFTVGLQTVKAASVNPTQCLKDE